MTSPTQIAHYIHGSVAKGASTRHQPVYNPATGAITGQVSLASVADVNTAVAAAQQAFRLGLTRHHYAVHG